MAGREAVLNQDSALTRGRGGALAAAVVAGGGWRGTAL